MGASNVNEETTIGVVGAGNMGAGIAQKYATEGFRVVVVDLTEKAVVSGRERVEHTLTEAVARKLFDDDKREAILKRMTFTSDKSALKKATLVVEAVFEDKAVKQTLFKELDGICGPTTILATNTSSFYVDDVAATCRHPDRVLGLHYFYHPAKNKLVEVIKGSKTSNEVFQRAWTIQERSGKTPIRSSDAPGFIVNRFFVPWLNESMRLVEENIASIATVEAIARETFGIGLGPFELMNVTGVPITLHASTTLETTLGAFYRPADLIRSLVAEKRQWDLAGDVDESKRDAIVERLCGVVFYVAAQLATTEKVGSIEDCDLGARVGLRWPKGPFEMMNDLGTKTARQWVARLAKMYPDVVVPPVLDAHGKENRPFEIPFVVARVEGHVGTITINRPDALNALSETVVEQLGKRFAALLADDDVKGIVIEGRGKAFVAGADVRYFVDQIQAGDVDRIVRFAANGQKVFRDIDRSPKPVVCKLDGLSLGGGSELALACDFVVATSSGSMGFPETGIGIYPGLGGITRTVRRVGVPLARWLVMTGQMLDAKKACAVGLIDEVVDDERIDAACRERALTGVAQERSTIPNAHSAAFEAEFLAFSSSTHEIMATMAGKNDVDVPKLYGRLRQKAPIALREAERILVDGSRGSVDDSLALETAGLSIVFRTADALEGLSKAGRGRPTFVGR